MSKLATKILDNIQNELKLDPQWTSRNSDSLTWVAHRLKQTFSVSEPFNFMEKETVALESRIPLVRNVGRSRKQVCGLLSQFNNTTIGSAYVFDTSRQEVFSSLKVMVSEADLQERCWIARTFALIQLIMAEHQGQYILDAVSGKLAKADPARQQPDDMLNSFMGFLTSRPRSENRFESRDEFKRAAEYCEKMGGVSSDADHPGRTLEFRFTDSATSVASLVTDAEHPTVGRGLRTLLLLPISYQSNGQAALAANKLNLREVTDHKSGNFLGAWSIDNRTQNLSPVYSAFMPNALFSKTLTAMIAAQLGIRASTCEHWLFPEDQFSKTALEIVLARKNQIFEGDETTH